MFIFDRDGEIRIFHAELYDQNSEDYFLMTV